MKQTSLTNIGSSAGFTMVEVMVALSLFAIIMGGLAPVFGSFSKLNLAAEVRSGAMAAAQQRMDALRLENPQDMPTSGTDGGETIEVDGRGFSVMTIYCARAEYCPSANTRHLKVQVDYRDEEVLELETVFTKLR